MSHIGILSMQRIKNYGSFLQAYALKSILEGMGHNVEFVDYHIEKPIIDSDEKSNGIISKGLNSLKGDASLKHKLQYIVHKKNFGRKYYKLLGVDDEYKYNTEVDTLVIGSDEVFNCIQSNKNVGYSLELFGKNNNAKKVITYAASFGNTTIEKLEKYNKKEEISECLKNIDSISARDKNSLNIIKKLTGLNVEYHLDPVLVYDYMNRKDLIPDIKTKKKYIIVYAYSGRITKDESKYIRKYAKERNCKVYSIGGAQKCADKFIDCNPFEVLSYFKNAELIITDTFHGSIFSIITKSNFVTLVRKSVGNKYGNEEKLTDLLSRLSLSDRITYNICDINKILEKNINYNEVQKIIDSERKNTYDYLKERI